MKDLLNIDPSDVILNLSATSKDGVLSEFAEKFSGRYPAVLKEGLVNLLLDRESLGSTGIGEGIAIPHCKSPALKAPVILFGRSSLGVEFHAVDDKPVRIFFLLVTPSEAAAIHLKLLSRISRLLKGASVKNRLLEAIDEDEIVAIVMEHGGV